MLRAVEFPAENSQIGKSGLQNEWSRTARCDLIFLAAQVTRQVG